jgi:hypothetical protein
MKRWSTIWPVVVLVLGVVAVPVALYLQYLNDYNPVSRGKRL